MEFHPQTRRFERLVIMPSAAVEAVKYTFPVFSTDGAHMKGPMNAGVMKMIVTVDGDKRIVPLAYMLCPGERAEEYNKLFKIIMEHPHAGQMMERFNNVGSTWVTDRAKGLGRAIHESCPLAHHRYGPVPLKRNMPTLPIGNIWIGYVNPLGKSTHMSIRHTVVLR